MREIETKVEIVSNFDKSDFVGGEQELSLRSWGIDCKEVEKASTNTSLRKECCWGSGETL